MTIDAKAVTLRGYILPVTEFPVHFLGVNYILPHEPLDYH